MAESISHLSCQPVPERNHAERLAEWSQRMVRFAEENDSLAKHLTVPLVDLNKEGKGFVDYKCELDIAENCGTLTRAATPYCHELRAIHKGKAVHCRVYNLTAVTFDLSRAVRIQKYFSSRSRLFFLQVFSVLKRGPNMYMFHYRMPYSNLYHKVCSQQVNIDAVKRWSAQLAEAAEMMNLAGVAHRFIRPENILLTQNDGRIIVAAFDLACLYWNAIDRQSVMQPRGLPSEVPSTLWDHLPPECFDQQYDATNLDSWSIGVLLCTLLASSHPFNQAKPSELIAQWRRCSQRRRLPDEFRSLLDDIFLPADKRLTVFDMAKDRRLHGSSWSVFKRVRSVPYYRIDLNQTEPERPTQPVVLRQVTPGEYSDKCLEMFQIIGHKTVYNEQELKRLPAKKYIVLRNQSFTDECRRVARHEHYLRVMVQGEERGWVRVMPLRVMPVRHRDLLYVESIKIMRFFANQKCQFVHCIDDIFLTKIQKLYIFYSAIPQGGSLLDRPFEQTDLLRLMSQLAEAIDFFTFNGVAHRYIRPEYVLLCTDGNIKITHFDMACFTWNPVCCVQVSRSRGLPDYQEHRWSHLPPECFLDKYDPSLVDEWSFGVVLVHCLTGSNPFTVPHSIELATQRWNLFKTELDNANRMANFIKLLDRIFLSAEERIHSDRLERAFRQQLTNDQQ